MSQWVMTGRAWLRRLLDRARLMKDESFLILFLLFGYLLIARGLGDFYPFSTFPMYSNNPVLPASRVFVKDSRSELRDVARFGNWECPADVELNPEHCFDEGQYYFIPYVDREVLEMLSAPRQDVMGESENVSLVRRIWRFTDAGPAEVSDCLISDCRAVRK